MNMCRKHSAWAIAGMLITLTIGSPVWADDVELLLSTPGGLNSKPNILFILDSSGSMTTVEESQEPYDGSETYTGPCDLDMYYWGTTSAIPNCGDDYKFKKTVFNCQQGITQARSAGSYTDTMSMYRPNNGGGKWKWRTLRSNLQDNVVDCQADSGDHGSVSDPTPDVYVRRGVNKPTLYTSNPDDEVAWGSSATYLIITVFDSNYLNWYYNPPGSSMRRTDIVKAVTKNVLGSINNANVGFMRFHREQGGPVIHALKDLDDNRAEAIEVVDNLPAAGYTPLSETLYEAALYWNALPGYYGEADATDPDALVSSDPMIYKHPTEYSCSKNYVVLLTDGEPTRDTDAYYKVPNLPNYQDVMDGATSCDGGNVNGACLDDIAEYLSKTDINSYIDGQQSVTTYTIGFTVDLELLKETAESSGGEYYLASDVKTLTTALTDIVTNIFDRDVSFTAPAVAVNALNRTQHLNDLYISTFRPSSGIHWPGNIKKYTLRDSEIRDSNDNNAVDPGTGYFSDNSNEFWNGTSQADGADVLEAGAANLIPDPASRKVYTNNSLGSLTANGNAFSTANATSFTDGDFGLTGTAGEPSMEDLIDWTRGVDIKDIDNDPETTVRASMGDSLHAQPATVVYGDPQTTGNIVLFNATNDGLLHAIDAGSGEELWSFIPRELFLNLKELYFDEDVNYKNYGLDGNLVPIVADLNEDGLIEVGTDFAYLVFGMRRGGDNYYLLDVTDKNYPSIKWVRTFPESGQSWSPPTVARIQVNSAAATGSEDAVLVLGGGYDTSHDTPAPPTDPDLEGAAIFILDLETGDQIWRAGLDNGADLPLDLMKRSIPSQIRVIDINGDSFADRMYTADLGGQVWRFDITNGEIPGNLVAGGVIASLGADALEAPTMADARRFYSTPDIAMFIDQVQSRRYLSVSLGSGYRAHPLDKTTNDRFYSMRDPDIFNRLTQTQYNNYSVIEDADLVEVQGDFGTVISTSDRGWKLTIPGDEKVLASSRTFDNTIYFVTFEPEVSSTDPCTAGQSVNRLYAVNVENGDAVVALEAPVPETPEDADAARITELQQGGIAPVPIFLFPSDWGQTCEGGECPKPKPVGCVGVECFDPEFENRPVRTLWIQDGVE